MLLNYFKEIHSFQPILGNEYQLKEINSETNKLILILNPFFISFIICVSILKSITTILMKEDKCRLLMIGDFAYFINARYAINSVIII